MITKTYTAKWRDGFENFYKDVDANKVAQEIMSIGENATPEQIVERARDEKTELHRCFEWDNATAAENWRKHEARQLSYRLVIDIPKRTPEEPPIRFFVCPEGSGGYTATHIVVERKDEYDALLETAKEELRRFKAKYSFIKELQNIFNLID